MFIEMVTKNLETKAMALMIAVALWYYALNEHSGKWSCYVPVVVEADDDVAILNEPQESIYATFKGPEKLIRDLKQEHQSGNVKAVCRIEVGADSTLTEREFKIQFKDARDFTGVPEGVWLDSVPSPEYIQIIAMRHSARSLPVKLQTEGNVPPGYEIVPNSEAIFPAEVTVKGPKKALDAAKFVYTKPFRISEWPTLGGEKVSINDTIGLEQVLRVQTPNGEKTYPVTCEGTVQFWIDLVRKREEITISKIPLKVLQPPGFPYAARPVEERIEIKVRGPKAMLTKLNNKNVTAYVDVSGLQPTKAPHNLSIGYVLPVEVQGKVEVTVNPAKTGVDVLAPPKPPKTKEKPPAKQ
ncbi:MAG: YbbR-like domain-containing protein [Planctomycetes bacterium]|nr:YbbR-like domain-containing protein [Planctomycetota bacterium]